MSHGLFLMRPSALARVNVIPDLIRNPFWLCQRYETLDQVRGRFGASASIVLPGGIRVLEPPDPIPNSAVK